MAKIKNYPLPVYLNQRIIFDILAIIEGGFSNVTQVKEVENISRNRQQTGVATFGVTNVLSSLLKIDLTANNQNQLQNQSQKENSFEKIHTPTSILSRVMEYMIREGELNVINSTLNPQKVNNGEFIDILTSLSPDPIFKMTDGLSKLIANISSSKHLFGDSLNDDIGEQISVMDSILNNKKTTHIIGELHNSNYKLLVSIEPDSVLNSIDIQSITGKYRVFGKISNIITSEKEEVNLSVGTSFDMLQSMSDSVNLGISQMPNQFADKFRDRTVKGPLIQVTPIAIYV